jgi:hypothetical protein
VLVYPTASTLAEIDLRASGRQRRFAGLFRSEDEGLSSKFDVLPFKGNREHDFFFADP